MNVEEAVKKAEEGVERVFVVFWGLCGVVCVVIIVM